MRMSESGTYQAICKRMEYVSPAFTLKGTYKDAPGASPCIGAFSTMFPSAIAFQAMVRGSHHPPRNQQ